MIASEQAELNARLGALPSGLADAFTGYEHALMANDLAVLDRYFADGGQTLRGDEKGLRVGKAAISAFRGGRGGVATREIVELHAHLIDSDAVLLVSVSRFTAGGTGLQTQLWRRDGGEWRIHSAHVTGRPRAFDTAVWQAVGNPLVAPAQPAHVSGDASPAPTTLLAGLRIGVKDLFAVRGLPTGLGNPTFRAEAEPAAANARAVQQLLDAGAAVTGITQTDEFAYSIAGMNDHYGTPPNPAASGRISGGSSSGSASATALGQIDVGLGTDTGGSIRVPSSYQGLWGIRTTHDFVDRTGLTPLAPRFDTVGWMARDVETLARVADVLTPDTDVHPWPPAGDTPQFVRLRGVDQLLQADVFEAFDSCSTQLGARIGATFDEVAMPWLAEAQEGFRVLQAWQAWQSHGDWVSSHLEDLGAAVRGRFAFASTVTSSQAEDAAAVVETMAERIHETLEDRILLLPSASSVAPTLDADETFIDVIRSQTLRLTGIAGISGRPAVSAPLMRAGGLPVGLCLVGPRETDRALISQAAQVADLLSASTR